MLVLLVGANRMKCLYSNDPYYGTKDVRLLEVQIDPLGRLFLDEIDGLPDVERR